MRRGLDTLNDDSPAYVVSHYAHDARNGCVLGYVDQVADEAPSIVKAIN